MAYNQSETMSVALSDGTLVQAVLSGGSITIGVAGSAYGANNYYASATVEFPAIDLTKYFNGSTSLAITSTNPAGTSLTTYTATSSDNVTFGAWQALNNDNTIQSSDARYIKIKCEMVAKQTDQQTTVNDFTSAEATQFDEDAQVSLDGSLYLKTSYSDTMTADASWTGYGKVFTSTVSKSSFLSVNSLTVT